VTSCSATAHDAQLHIESGGAGRGRGEVPLAARRVGRWQFCGCPRPCGAHCRPRHYVADSEGGSLVNAARGTSVRRGCHASTGPWPTGCCSSGCKRWCYGLRQKAVSRGLGECGQGKGGGERRRPYILFSAVPGQYHATYFHAGLQTQSKHDRAQHKVWCVMCAWQRGGFMLAMQRRVGARGVRWRAPPGRPRPPPPAPAPLLPASLLLPLPALLQQSLMSL
jgi:hypothetical protein